MQIHFHFVLIDLRWIFGCNSLSFILTVCVDVSHFLWICKPNQWCWFATIANAYCCQFQFHILIHTHNDTRMRSHVCHKRMPSHGNNSQLMLFNFCTSPKVIVPVHLRWQFSQLLMNGMVAKKKKWNNNSATWM